MVMHQGTPLGHGPRYTTWPFHGKWLTTKLRYSTFPYSESLNTWEKGTPQRKLPTPVAQVEVWFSKIEGELSLTGPAEQLFKRTKVGSSKEKYPAELRAFALTLQFCSNKAYEYVHKTFSTSLLYPATIRRWCKTVEGNPGFTYETFITLKQKSTEAMSAGKKIICWLIVDEISIRKHIEWDGDKFSGYVDLGTQLDNYCLPPAKQALTFMLNANWKIPVAYFLIDSFS
ncbi:hypothetical protein AVEN_113954-1 [Araneus ventricosus]|uniref:DNA transposase THAP9 n=1 Tax=Araneus ventricosus TaxID=182803 RepID=A0A4Y2IXX5_ARAVE|nr:hypothetical protein AVEN_113954-1 [Araneus ventricosus]